MTTVSQPPENIDADPKSRQPAIQADGAELREASIGPKRKRLPDTRDSVTHKLSISGHEGYVTVGLYDDGSPGEVFLVVAKEGSTLRGLLDTVAVLTSMCLQYGVPVETLARKFEHSTFEPSGHTTNPEIRLASSITDYVFRWLGLTFSDAYRKECAARVVDVGRASLPEEPNDTTS